MLACQIYLVYLRIMATPESVTNLPGLQEAYDKKDTLSCYKLIEGLPSGSVLDVDRAVFELVEPLPEEETLMQDSLREGRELALIMSAAQKYRITGQDLSISIDDFFPELSWTFKPEDTPGIFTHTHPSREVNPFPSWGDIFYWEIIAERYPNVQNRIVYSGNDGIRAFKFMHFYGTLFNGS